MTAEWRNKLSLIYWKALKKQTKTTEDQGRK